MGKPTKGPLFEASVDVQSLVVEILDMLNDEVNPRTQAIEAKLQEIASGYKELVARQARTETMVFKLAMHLGIRPRTGERYCDAESEHEVR